MNDLFFLVSEGRGWNFAAARLIACRRFRLRIEANFAITPGEITSAMRAGLVAAKPIAVSGAHDRCCIKPEGLNHA